MANPGAVDLVKAAMQAHGSGDMPHAEQLYRRALAADPGHADAWHLLALALAAQFRLDDASQAAARATALRRSVPGYWITTGTIEEDRGNAREAESAYRRAIALNPLEAHGHYGLGRVLQRKQRLGEAIAAYRAGLRGEESPQIRYALGLALFENNRPAEALAACHEAFRRDPEDALDRRECFEHMKRISFDSLPQFWHDEVVRFFSRPDIDKSYYSPIGLQVLMLKPEFAAVRAAARNGEFHPPPALDQVMQDELFGVLLRDTVLADAGMEEMLTRVRRHLLLAPARRDQASLRFLCDLALQCANNEFVFSETPEETSALRALRGELEGRMGIVPPVPPVCDDACWRSLAIYAAFRPLRALAGIDSARLIAPAHGPVEALLRRTIDDRLEEERLRRAIPSMGAITDETSRRVRAQYEENPYPRWFSNDRFPAVPAAAWFRANVPGMGGDIRGEISGDARDEPSRAPRVLVAGCGTGKMSIILAGEIQDVRVTAVDISSASLAYGARMARELDVGNVHFVQADILELGKLDERFDFIDVTGVLHHLRDPREGLRVLVRLLQPGGLMRVGLYSAIARRAVGEARALIERRGLQPAAESIRSFRRLALAADSGSALRALTHWRDFFSMSECRDLAFHVQEHQYRLPEAIDLLRGEGLQVLGMWTRFLGRALPHYRAMFPDDEVATDPSRWDALEHAFPAAFDSMYFIWCKRPRG
jgi:ubiquinone/menaquinone biosynthesis C-methylase UbiE/tetratricopeptide (TPR) repeat protein